MKTSTATILYNLFHTTATTVLVKSLPRRRCYNYSEARLTCFSPLLMFSNTVTTVDRSLLKKVPHYLHILL
jgi:hypothetical protein